MSLCRNLERAGPKFTKLPITERGHFYSGDCYLVLYTYYDERDYNAQKYIAYFWSVSPPRLHTRAHICTLVHHMLVLTLHEAHNALAQYARGEYPQTLSLAQH